MIVSLLSGWLLCLASLFAQATLASSRESGAASASLANSQATLLGAPRPSEREADPPYSLAAGAFAPPSRSGSTADQRALTIASVSGGAVSGRPAPKGGAGACSMPNWIGLGK